jgi:hypothetical protein
MKTSLIILFVSISIFEGYGQNFNPIQFDTISREVSTKELFLINVVEKDKDIFEIEKVNYTALEIFKKYKQTRRAVQNEIINNQNIIIGQLYAIERYLENDTIFKFENLKFNRFEIYSDNENKTVAFKLFGGNQKLEELFKFIKKYNLEDKNSVAETFKLQDYYNLKLKNKTIFLKVTNDMNVEPSMSIADFEQTTSNELNEKFSPPIELTVIFNNLGIELEEYIKENNYFR